MKSRQQIENAIDDLKSIRETLTNADSALRNCIQENEMLRKMLKDCVDERCSTCIYRNKRLCTECKWRDIKYGGGDV